MLRTCRKAPRIAVWMYPLPQQPVLFRAADSATATPPPLQTRINCLRCANFGWVGVGQENILHVLFLYCNRFRRFTNFIICFPT